MPMSNDDAEIIELSPARGTADISVLMPVFEQENFIAESVFSVLQQRGVTAEVIISDDASADGTFAVARRCAEEALRVAPVPHRVIMRRGRQRLWRNHLPALVEMASSDLVCQAHGDDISQPERLWNIVAGFRRHENCAMVSSGYDVIWTNHTGTYPVRTVLNKTLTERNVIYGHPNLMGCSMAWRRSLMRWFPRLDTHFAAVAHDRILAFRAFLTGSILLIEHPLLKRRQHVKQAHLLSFDEPDNAGHFGWNLTTLTQLHAMSRDLATALECGLVDQERHDSLAILIADVTQEVSTAVVEAHKRYTNQGLHIAWLDQPALMKLKNI